MKNLNQTNKFQMKAKEQEANSVLGDRMQQKIDSVMFNQSKMQKQMNDLQHKVQVSFQRYCFKRLTNFSSVLLLFTQIILFIMVLD